MRSTLTYSALALIIAGGALGAQQPDSVRADSIRRAQADSAARDSIAIVRELERIGRERRRDVVLEPVPMTPQPVVQGPASPTLQPNISVIGDFLADLSPDGSTLEDGSRATMREVELGLQAAVDPYFRADFFLGLHTEGIEIEEAYLSTLALPWSLQLRLGKFLLPVGKQNTTHRPELHTIEHSWVVQDFLGPEGLKGTGAWVSKIFAPLGFYQELQLAAVDRFGGEEHAHGEEEAEPELVTDAPANEDLAGLGYVARFRNYWDIGSSSNIELSASVGTGKRPVEIGCVDATATPVPCPGDITAVNARQSVGGVDLTFRWRPLGRGLYRSFILQGEWMRQFNVEPEMPDFGPGTTAGPVEEARDFDGAYVFARYQLTRRLHIGGRYDWLQDPHDEGETFSAASGYLTFFPSEFSKMVLGVEQVMPPAGEESLTRVLLQATFAIGPHRPHPF